MGEIVKDLVQAQKGNSYLSLRDLISAGLKARNEILERAIETRKRFEPLHPAWWLFVEPRRRDKVEGIFEKCVLRYLNGNAGAHKDSEVECLREEYQRLSPTSVHKKTNNFTLSAHAKVLFCTIKKLKHWWIRDEGISFYRAYGRIPKLLKKRGVGVIFEDIDEIINTYLGRFPQLWLRSLKIVGRKQILSGKGLSSSLVSLLKWQVFTSRWMHIGKIIRDRRPSVVVEHGTPNSVMSRALAFWCQKLDIPLVQIPNYCVSHFRMSYVLSPSEVCGENGVPLATTYTVCGEQCRHVLEESGIPPDRVGW